MQLIESNIHLIKSYKVELPIVLFLAAIRQLSRSYFYNFLELDLTESEKRFPWQIFLFQQIHPKTLTNKIC